MYALRFTWSKCNFWPGHENEIHSRWFFEREFALLNDVRTHVRTIYTPNLEEIKLDRSGRAQSRRLKDTGLTKNRARTDPAAAADDDGGVPHVDYGLGLNLLTGGRRGEDRNLIPTRAYVPTTCTVRYTYDVLMHFAAWIISSRRTKQPRRDWK